MESVEELSSLTYELLRNEQGTVVTTVPSKQLLSRSLHITAPGKQFTEWTNQNHIDSYHFMQRTQQAWKTSGLTDQYLVYGKICPEKFHWELIPYQKCRTFLGRIFQQIQVLWRSVFGGISVSTAYRTRQFENYKTLLEDTDEKIHPTDSSSKSNDSFCKLDTIERQWVITGEKVNVLYNYAPIGFGGERLHFLVVPKDHRETFADVTEDEYSEVLRLTTHLVNHVIETRPTVKNIYLLNKSGRDAGQTVKHWHLQVICTTTATHDFWGKLTVLKNILLGSSPMKKEALSKKVGELRAELNQ